MTATPKNVTIYGRLSYPTFTMEQARARNSTSDFPRADADVAPEFNILVEQDQLDKLVEHVKNVFLPYCVAKTEAPGKKDSLDAKQADRIAKALDEADWENQPPYLCIKPVPEKTQELAPEAVANIKVTGNRGKNISLRAIVSTEEELAAPDGTWDGKKKILPIEETVHEMYGGCYVAATLNLYSFVSGKLPGFSAGAGVAVFKEDGESFGTGGVSIDEDDIFML